MLQHLVLHLLPPCIMFLSDQVAVAQPQLGAARETIKALVAWSTGLPEDQKPRAYGVLLPTLGLLLDPEGEDSHTSGLHQVSVMALLGLAQGAPKAFRDATLAMPEDERGRLERAIRSAVGGQAKVAPATGVEKKGIELRSFG